MTIASPIFVPFLSMFVPVALFVCATTAFSPYWAYTKQKTMRPLQALEQNAKTYNKLTSKKLNKTNVKKKNKLKICQLFLPKDSNRQTNTHIHICSHWTIVLWHQHIHMMKCLNTLSQNWVLIYCTNFRFDRC